MPEIGRRRGSVVIIAGDFIIARDLVAIPRRNTKNPNRGSIGQCSLAPHSGLLAFFLEAVSGCTRPPLPHPQVAR
jgi:hypothetical protein